MAHGGITFLSTVMLPSDPVIDCNGRLRVDSITS